ncbi:MAG: alpha/beta hydrolase, partial [Cyanomargarita calcarea GSE-NOS-MK-12-04C]|nr:alpha/beta hydrolase [Cyanomargarita calcarea GSE-NOS-MK-12-04C]
MVKSFKILPSFLSALAFIAILTAAGSVKAADSVVLRFGPFAESISLAELNKSAETGKFPSGYEMYANKLSEEQRRIVLGALKMKLPLNVVTVDRLLNTQIGKAILDDIATAIQRKDNAGVQAMRAGLVLGSTAEQGLCVLSFIAAYPSKRLEIDLPQAFRVALNLNTSFWQTQRFMVAISPQLSRRNPKLSLPFDPRKPGNAEVKVLNLAFDDLQRQRQIPVDVYSSSAASPNKPVIVFTHGLGSVRTELRYLAEHLASHGYVVAALEHPGSNETNTNAALGGKNRLLKPQEFLERPRDISFVLDELEKLNKTVDNSLRGKLDTNNTMVIGYSFGGGTALNIAGGELQLEGLKRRCKDNLVGFSLGETIQCVAQELPENKYQLRDSRIKRAIALSPTTSLMFGDTGLTKVQVPTLVLASSADKTTPALTEQIVGFEKIPSPKWFVGVVGGTHLSVKDPSATMDQVGKPNTPFSGGEVVGEKAVDVRQYVKAISLAFAAQMTTEAKDYAVFLTSDYAQVASTKAFPIRLVTEIPPNA